MKIIFTRVLFAALDRVPQPPSSQGEFMDNEQVFTPIADPGQLAHDSASHSNALVENPFDDTEE
ncbi:hypothetical protein GCM10018772_19400 [Streptomyces fumanus]|uniref:Uncharacterized protein n=1 Tax=Streptomyces fumanus TaxID=67302 RepID=A0A919AAF8_9ACTN|nr:hypothetical protein GCM10018772_19400 [Streptomyces fumanus]